LDFEFRLAGKSAIRRTGHAPPHTILDLTLTHPTHAAVRFDVCLVPLLTLAYFESEDIVVSGNRRFAQLSFVCL
jgi:hypothetical protein